MTSQVKALLAFVAALGVSSCSSTGGVESGQALDEIGIDPIVKVTDKVYYNGPENNWGFAIGGLVGAAIASQAISEPQRIKLYMDQQHIDIGGIVKAQYQSMLERSPQFSGKVRDQAKNRVELEVQMYGIAQKGTFSSEYKPLLRVRSSLVGPDGKVLWSKADFVANLNGETPGYTYKELFESSGAMSNAFTIAAKETVKSLVPSP